MFDKLLVLSTHCDDEVLGCGGTLLKHKDNRIHIHYFNNHHTDTPYEQYSKEALNVKEYLGCTVSYSKHMCVNELNQFPITLYITEIENLINTYQPDMVFIPAKSTNQDHRVVHEAALTAMRVHDVNWIVPNIFICEQPETHTPVYNEFRPDYYVPIDIYDKLQLYQIYQSQIRGHRSLAHIHYLAGMRGMQCGMPFAEAFQIVRMIHG